MVAAANPLAADAGYRVLKAGGSALDAAIAIQMVLALVEPQSSGLGGGAFLFVAAPNNTQFGYFKNFGRTRRDGFEAAEPGKAAL